MSSPPTNEAPGRPLQRPPAPESERDDRRFLSSYARLGILITLVVAGAIGAGAYVFLRDDRADAGDAATRFLAAWDDGDANRLADFVDEPEAIVAATEQVNEDLQVIAANRELTDVATNGDEAIAHFDTTLNLAGLGEWTYESAASMSWDGEQWTAMWRPQVLHPDMAEGQRMARASQWPERAPILGAGDEPLVTAGPGVIIGIEPRRLTNKQMAVDALQVRLGVDPAAVDAALSAPGVQPNHFVPIVTVPETRYNQVSGVIYPIPGLRFRDTTMRTAPSAGFARHLLGRTGEITAERLEQLGEPYAAGDVVGLSGLEASFERQLAGTPTGSVTLLGADGQAGDEAADGEQAAELHRFEGTPPEPVRTTIDPAVQAAAEAALAGITGPAALVAVDTSGAVRAVVSRPLDDGFNRALSGQYPPGSTFKIITTAALLSAGLGSDSTVQCDPTTTVEGRSFRNFEGGAAGAIPLSRAFADSCNTAMISAAQQLDPSALRAAAENFGFNADYSIGVGSVGASFPDPGSEVERAASAIGQSEVTASPLHMATVAAAVRAGRWQPPTLLPDGPPPQAEAPGDDASDGDTATTAAAPTPPPEPRPLDRGVSSQLAALMRLVVTDGSGTRAEVPGEPVHGKSGTAEFGGGDPPPTHAWFVAYRGDLAAAIVVEGGGVGGRVAAPLMGRFFTELSGG